MMRSSVLLPEPDWPSRATISPSRKVKSTPESTGRALPSAERKLLPTSRSSMMGWAMASGSSEMHPVLGQAVQPAPEQVVETHHEHAHDPDAQCDAREVARGGHVRDVAAQALGLRRRVAPADVLGHDARIPGAAAGGDGAGDETRKDGRQQVALPL